MSNADRVVLVTGATGSQGGAVARELLAKGWKVRALTRKPDSDGAKALAKLGAEVVTGDLDDAASLQRALTGAWGVWAVQNTWEAGVEKEEDQGKRLAKLAREVGVRHFVYSSVGSADVPEDAWEGVILSRDRPDTRKNEPSSARHAGRSPGRA